MDASEKNEATKNGNTTNQVDTNPAPQKNAGSPRVKIPKIVPKYDKEMKKYRSEVLESILLFRAARKNWLQLVASDDLRQKADSQVFYGLEIDRRRAAVIKKLGFKLSMIRRHRKTLRPWRYFTMKKRLSGIDYDQEFDPALNLEEDAITIEPELLEIFNNRVKLIIEQLPQGKLKKKAKKLYAIEESLGKQEKLSTDENLAAAPTFGSEKIKNEGSANKIRRLPLKFGKAKKRMLVSDEEISDDGDLDHYPVLSASSQELFDQILADMIAETNNTRTFTDEEIVLLKKFWIRYRNETIEELAPKVKGRTKLVDSSRKVWNRLKSAKSKLRSKSRKRERVKPCKCQILEGDKIFILKSHCDCSAQLQRKNVVLQDETEFIKDLLEQETQNVETIPANREASTDIAEKVVDSLEVIRKKGSLKSISKESFQLVEQKQESFEEAGKTPDESSLAPTDVTGMSVKEATKFEMSTPVISDTKNKPINIETKSSGKENPKEELPETTEKNETTIEIQGIIKKKTRLKEPKLDEVVPGETNSGSDEQLDMKEIIVIKEPQKSISLTSGKGKSSVERRTTKEMEEIEVIQTDDGKGEPKPILGKGKRKKGRTEQGHVSFDVEAKTASSTLAKYGESTKETIKTVMSVMSTIVKRN